MRLDLSSYLQSSPIYNREFLEGKSVIEKITEDANTVAVIFPSVKSFYFLLSCFDPT